MKNCCSNPEVTFPDYPAVFAIWGENKKDEAQRVADLIYFSKTQGNRRRKPGGPVAAQCQVGA